MRSEEKPMLNIEEILAKMEQHGVQFNIENKEIARKYLEQHNYYFKLMAYRENYHKDANNKYVNLEFAYLHELADIDRDLRYIVLLMCLDIEHYLKVKLLYDMSLNSLEDGYTVVQQFIDWEKSLNEMQISKAETMINAKRKSEYCKALIDKCHNQYSAWVFVELISFGEFVSFYDFYNDNYAIKDHLHVLLNYVKDIRNVAAHSNCLINKLAPMHIIPHNDVIKRVEKICNIKGNLRDKKLHNKSMLDLTALCFAYDEIVVDSNTRRIRCQQLRDLIDKRMLLQKDWFQNNCIISSSYQYLKAIVDYLWPPMLK